MDNKRKNFYIFLDIDGVLWDWNWRLDAIDKGKIKNRLFVSEFNPKSMEALNFLIEEMNKTHNTKVVISSTWRGNLELADEVLRANNINYDDELLATKISGTPAKRGEEILEFLNTHESGDFIILDDESFDFKNHFSPDKIIKTSLYDKSLSMEHINKWLKDNEKKQEDGYEREI